MLSALLPFSTTRRSAATAHRARAGRSCATPSLVWRACCHRWVSGFGFLAVAAGWQRQRTGRGRASDAGHHPTCGMRAVAGGFRTWRFCCR
jgi:hypothetical protein